jgi:rubredoxin
MEQEQNSCPKCGSYKVSGVGKLAIILTGMGLFSLGIWFLLIPVVGIAMMVTGLVLSIAGIFAKKTYTCDSCGFQWTPSKTIAVK